MPVANAAEEKSKEGLPLLTFGDVKNNAAI